MPAQSVATTRQARHLHYKEVYNQAGRHKGKTACHPRRSHASMTHFPLQSPARVLRVAGDIPSAAGSARLQAGKASTLVRGSAHAPGSHSPSTRPNCASKGQPPPVAQNCAPPPVTCATRIMCPSSGRAKPKAAGSALRKKGVLLLLLLLLVLLLPLL